MVLLALCVALLVANVVPFSPGRVDPVTETTFEGVIISSNNRAETFEFYLTLSFTIQKHEAVLHLVPTAS